MIRSVAFLRDRDRFKDVVFLRLPVDSRGNAPQLRKPYPVLADGDVPVHEIRRVRILIPMFRLEFWEPEILIGKEVVVSRFQMRPFTDQRQRINFPLSFSFHRQTLAKKRFSSIYLLFSARPEKNTSPSLPIKQGSERTIPIARESSAGKARKLAEWNAKKRPRFCGAFFYFGASFSLASSSSMTLCPISLRSSLCCRVTGQTSSLAIPSSL